MKKFRVLFFIFIISMFMIMPVYARAGGGGSSSGGGSSHYPTTHNNSTRSRGLNLFGVGFVLIASSGACIGFRIKVNKKKRVSMKLIKKIDDMDSAWDKNKLFARVHDVYFGVQEAWMQKDLEALKKYISDSLYDNWKTKLEWMDLRNEKNILDCIKLKNADIVGVYDAKNNDQDMVWFCIEGSMVDYIMNLETNEIVEGNKTAQSFTEYWKFIRKGNEFYLDEVRQKDEMDINNFINLSEEINHEDNGSSLWNSKK